MGLVPESTLADAQAALQRHEASQTTIAALLAQMLDQMGTSPITVAVTDTEVSPGAEVEFPVPGTARQTIKRITAGGVVVPDTAAVTLVVPSDNRRLGGTIINMDTAAGVTLLLADPNQTAGVARIWLAPGGGAWDMRLGNLLWCGNVSALSDAAPNGNGLAVAVV